MAQIKFDNLGKNRSKRKNSVQPVVKATYSFFDKNSNKYFQLETYGKTTRKNVNSVSQTIQFDEETAAQLVDLLIDLFGLRYSCIKSENIKQSFDKFLNDNFRVMSYKLVFMISCLKLVDHNGKISADKLVNLFVSFYTDRYKSGLAIDRPRSVINEKLLKNKKKILQIILKDPFEKFEKRKFMFYSKENKEFSFNSNL